MNIFLPLLVIIAGAGYFARQLYHRKQKKPVTTQPASKPWIITKHCSDCGKEFQVERVSLPKPLFFNWKDQVCFALFGQKLWTKYREDHPRAKWMIHYFYPTLWLAGFCFFNVTVKLLGFLLFAWPLNWFFWLALVTLPLLGIAIFYQWKRLKQIPVNERKNHEI